MISILDNMSNMVKNLGNNVVFNTINNTLTQPIIFTLVFMLQMIFGHLGIVLVPKVVQDLGNNPLTRILLLSCIGFVATQNVGLALVGALSFALLMYLLRNNEEKDSAAIL
jgi:hypothetical protein